MKKYLRKGETYIRIQNKKNRKVTDIIKREEEKEIHLHKEEPVEGKSTSSKIIQTKDEIIINP